MAKRKSERERFEEAMRYDYPDANLEKQTRFSLTMYVDETVEDIWDGWRLAKRDAKRRKR